MTDERMEWLNTTAAQKRQEEWTPVSELEPGIYQGAPPSAYHPAVDAVVSLQHQVEMKFEFWQNQKALLWMPISDGPPFPGIEWLETVVNFIADCRKNEWSVLIHCSAGVSRSSMVSIAYYMKTKNWTVEKTLEYLWTKRKVVSPNSFFLEGLVEYEKHLLEHDSMWNGLGS